MKLKEKVLARANGYLEYNIRLREKMHKRFNRCYALVYSDGRIFDIYSSKRGAENEHKRLTAHSYYDEMTMEMTNSGSSLQIVEILLEDLLELDDFQLLYNSLWNDFRVTIGSFNFRAYNYIIEKYDLPKHWKETVKNFGVEIDRGSFPNIEEYEENKIDFHDIY